MQYRVTLKVVYCYPHGASLDDFYHRSMRSAFQREFSKALRPFEEARELWVEHGRVSRAVKRYIKHEKPVWLQWADLKHWEKS